MTSSSSRAPHICGRIIEQAAVHFRRCKAIEPPHHLRVRLLHIRQIDRLQNGTADSVKGRAALPVLHRLRVRKPAVARAAAKAKNAQEDAHDSHAAGRRLRSSSVRSRHVFCDSGLFRRGGACWLPAFSPAPGWAAGREWGQRRFCGWPERCPKTLKSRLHRSQAGRMGQGKRAASAPERPAWPLFCGCRAEFGQNIVNRLLLQLRRKAASAAQEQVIQLRIRLIQGQRHNHIPQQSVRYPKAGKSRPAGARRRPDKDPCVLRRAA